MKRFFILLMSLVTLFVLVGCDKGPQNSPRDTILGYNFQNRPDWIDEEEVYSEQGLSLRESAMHKGRDLNSYANNPAMTSVYFNFDNSGISPDERKKMPEVIAYLKENPNASLLIVGHCDYHGTQEYNLALGDRRANSVESYLESAGINSERLHTLSKGSLQAKYKGGPSEVWKDRRSDLIVLN